MDQVVVLAPARPPSVTHVGDVSEILKDNSNVYNGRFLLRFKLGYED